MITGEIKSQVDAIWDAFAAGLDEEQQLLRSKRMTTI